MRRNYLAATLLLAALAGFAGTLPADAQVINRLRRAAQNAVENETARQIERILANAVRCVFDDEACIEKAKSSGKDVVLTGDDGKVLMDKDGKPITDPSAVQKEPDKPGTGAWANYDFVPGERILFYDDFSNDRVGDFPRRLTFVRGNWEVVEWQGRPLLRNTGPRHSAVVIPLPEKLPERFTIEIETFFPDVTYVAVLATTSPAGDNWVSLPGNYFQIGAGSGTGVSAYSSSAVKATNQTSELSERLMPVRIMVDGQYAKVYVGERRVANVPNAEFIRSDGLYIENNYLASEQKPLLFGSIRVAAGGDDLYDVLERDGRVATQGILFATGSARIRPESTPTLNEIGTMLRAHPELRIAIEGHTDSDGEDAFNQDLSEQRAAAVKAYLVEQYRVADGRLETAGFGETKPVADNTSPEGKQQNRRVELVRR
jgi:outer membrane protein OmpA-like peptidoglycan-associated protein